MSEPTMIRVRGARAHNLRGVDVDVPRGALVVFTGVSGSGKSSLVYDTIHQEGQRRFMESLSAYARQFLGRMERPQVDAVEGVSPTISIDQKTVNRNPRSTVGTITELYDHLRLLMARLGTPHCPRCGTEVRRLAIDQVADRVVGTLDGQRVSVLAPVVRERKGTYRAQLEQLARDGWVRARVDGQLHELDQVPELARYEKHTIEVVVDRVRVGADRGRLTEALEAAARLAGGLVTVWPADPAVPEQGFALQRACPNHPEASVPELEPRLFSFNAPQGACGTCRGLGRIEGFAIERVVDLGGTLPAAYRAFNEDGRVPFANFDHAALRQVVRALGGSLARPLEAWPPDQLDRLLHGDPTLKYTVQIRRDGHVEARTRPWAGLLGMVEEVWRWTRLPSLAALRSSHVCPACDGKRLCPEALAVTFRGVDIHHLVTQTVDDAVAWFDALQLDDDERDIGLELVREIRERLGFLAEVGLGYLGLSRTADTLSGGEAQRIRLASQVGSALQGITYILDEPSIGLHPRDNLRLLRAIGRLRDRGNSVLVVEHDAETIAAADWVVDIGPGAGREGGQLVASAPPGQVARGDGVTAAWLRGERAIPVPTRRGPAQAWLRLRGASVHNLRGVDVELPLGRLVVVTGVSGSGKSSLVFQALEPSVRAALGGEGPVGCQAVEGVDALEQLVRISQTPIGRSSRSNPATYTKVFDAIRDLFAKTTIARERGWKKGRFSFNVPGGRCEACQGAGVVTVEMQFLPSVEVPCEVCDGRRFNAETLEARWKDHTIHDVLQFPIRDAVALFKRQRKIHRILATLDEVGLGYVALGQPSTTLSGGEAQRLKLATELHRPSAGRTLYLLDEPTTGLHFEDVARLIDALQRLVEAGNTVVVVEHHTDVIKVADHLVDLGPEGGIGGGQVVGVGTPEQLATMDTPTGRALAEALAARPPVDVTVPVAAEPALASGYGASRADALQIRGARRHNLKGVDVRIPHGALTVITGPSGSGKTSLAFDTVFAEGQRRYVESMSTYARRFLGRVERAPLTSIEGLQPAIAIDQRRAARNPRSTVATVTEIHDVLRILYARAGTPHCPTCARELAAHSPSEAAGALAATSMRAGWLCAALPPSQRPASYRKGLAGDGWTRLLQVDGEQVEQVELDDAERAEALLGAGCWLVIDRLDPARAARSRLAEAFERAYALGSGEATFFARAGGRATWAALPKCPEHGLAHPGELTPRHFSFNAQVGACTVCDGIGRTHQLATSRLFPRPSRGLWEAIDDKVAGVLRRSGRNTALIEALLARHGLDAQAPTRSYPRPLLRALLDGDPEPLALTRTSQWGGMRRVIDEQVPWPGLRPLLAKSAKRLAHLMAEDACPACDGGRLQPAMLAVRFAGMGIAELLALPVDEARARVDAMRLEGAAAVIAARPLLELRRRLRFLAEVGLGYLTLDRAAEGLSGGESQRIRLASQLGSGLVGCTYVLDEPTVGLHPRDTDRLLGTLEGLRDLGNTLVVVEHDPDTIDRADQVVDLGPAAGLHGGEVVAVGTPAQLRADPRSLTGRWLAGVERMPQRDGPRSPRGWMELRGASANNLRVERLRVPTGVWVAVSGVSGSGKSTLVMDTLAPALQATTGATVFAAEHEAFEPGEAVDRVIVVTQDPIGTTPRSSPATYCKVFDPIRALFAQLPAARERGWSASRFSWNIPQGGRCTVCEGRGSQLVEMHFLPDVWVRCEACGGRRFDRDTLAVRFKGRNIADVLAMRCDEALELFANQAKIRRPLRSLVDVGLGYLTLGQPANTLSGGEAQRVKLAAELTRRRGTCVYLLDEPTTGLHLADVARLVQVLHAAVDAGHTVITIEHHLDMLRAADWVIELGPGGGEAGGRIVAEGTPAQVAAADTATGWALRGG